MAPNYILFFFFLLTITISSAAACDRCLHDSKAAFFSTDFPLSSGACGYSSLAVDFNGGQIAAAIPSIFKDGAGCGACFKIRCKNQKLCKKEGTTVMVTDINTSNKTDFVLSSRAFTAMAKKGLEKSISKMRLIDVEYKRVPCNYKNQNLAVRVEESTEKPNYLAVKLLYQGGQTEILGIDVATVGSSNWMYLSRKQGAVWDTSRVPEGALQFRMVVTSGYDGKWVWAKNVLPADWTVGKIYDSGIQIDDIAQDGCNPCDDEGSL